MSTQFLKIEHRTLASGRVEIWTLTRPEVLNALNAAVLKEIDAAGKDLEQRLSKNPLDCRALIVTGAGEKAFVAGADIAEMKGFSASEGEAFGKLAQQAFTRLEKLPIPTLAAVNGYALGGGMELAMSCDVILASAKAQFGQPEAYLGLIPGFGGTARFADRLGIHKALELLYSGLRMKADEALARGLIQRIAPEDVPFLESALKLAEELTIKSAPLALAAIKRVVRSRNQQAIEDVQAREAEAFGKIFETTDSREGITAFLEKRPARFTGR